MFTDDDVDSMRLFMQANTTIKRATMHEARLIGGALARVAEVLVDEMWDEHVNERPSADAVATELVGSGIDMARIERLLLHLLRHQLVAAVYRRVTLTLPAGAEAPALAVGFADLVGFTALTQSLPPGELAALVMRFEEHSHDLVVAAGGRVVKTIGDEVMFTCADPRAAARLAIELARSGGDDLLPPMRVALAWGPVLLREGDCFGPTVNLASRLVGLAQPYEVIVSEDLQERLVDEPELEREPLDPIEIKDFGLLRVWRIRSQEASGSPP